MAFESYWEGRCPPHEWSAGQGQKRKSEHGARLPVLWKCKKCGITTIKTDKPKPNENK